MENISQHIAELEGEILRLRKQLGEEKSKSVGHKRDKQEGITIRDLSELTLDNCPLFVRQLLDHLPVQVFLKKAQLTAKGREYLYLNRKALNILRWESPKGKFDSDAFEGGVSSQEWKDMIDIETETIESGKVSVHELHWTSPLGDEYRVNNATGVPVRQVAADGSVDVLAFCAIAQDISFQQQRKTNQDYLNILLHEYGNLCAKIISNIRLGKEFSDDRYFEAAIGKATVAKDIAATLFKALAPSEPGETMTVQAVISELTRLTTLWRSARLRVKIDDDDGVRERKLANPDVVLATLVQLIANGEKHTSKEFREEGGTALIELGVCEKSTGVFQWAVTNRCVELSGRLDFSERGPKATLGGSILGNIIRLAFKTDNPGQFFVFPEKPAAESRVTVTFTHPSETI